MNRTRRLGTAVFLITPVLAVSPAVGARAATATAPDIPSRATCNVETESNGKYHLWGVGFPAYAQVAYSGSSTGTVSTDQSGRFDLGGLSGSKWAVKTADGKTYTCALVRH
ncbi:hypothetical protein [Streptomyces sp. NPDC051636]|uniref:hypothetical protein n=1 Tax=Streptomyces sp. NPDC051636 TaxID=3365663 RepID=UPI00378B40F7